MIELTARNAFHYLAKNDFDHMQIAKSFSELCALILWSDQRETFGQAMLQVHNDQQKV